MTLPSSDRARAERWLGELNDAQALAVEQRMVDLVRPAVVAYEALSIALSGMVQAPKEIRLEGDARITWRGSTSDLRIHLRGLYDFICSQGWTLNAEATEVMSGTPFTEDLKVVTATKYKTANPRP